MSFLLSYLSGFGSTREDDTIPRPPGVPILGNLTSMDRLVPARSWLLLWKQYGEIYQLNLLGRTLIMVNNYRLAREVLDENRFHKTVAGGLKEIRILVGDGLFTAYDGEPNWAIAHRILMPAFGPGNIKGMFDDMFDIATQLVFKWERFGPEHRIDPTDDFTRLALDTIALCSMHYRINSFYTRDMPPFAAAMGDFLAEAQVRVNRPALVNATMRGVTAKYYEDMKTMNDIVDKIIADRRANPREDRDLLDLMLNGEDPHTHQRLSEENIRYQLVTFLIAGHETTSGLLSFAMYYILKNPHVYYRLQKEVDEVLGGEPIGKEHLGKLPYIVAIMRETLRLNPTAPLTAVTPRETTVIGGKYLVKAGQTIGIPALCIHRDPNVWGEDAEEFKPERMLDGKFEATPPKAWSPFGNGSRACIGRAFAWQEAIIALATVFQRFDFRMEDPSYTVQLKQSLTIKPDGFYFYATPRSGARALVVGARTTSAQSQGKSDVHTPARDTDKDEVKIPLHVLYGSNTGSSEAFAQRIASAASGRGFKATISTLDNAVGHLPTNEPIIIITASFEGEPADNAGLFVEWIKSMHGSEMQGVKFGLFGCGNTDWVTTYQRVPKLIDRVLVERGAKRLVDRGEGNAAGDSFFEAFDNWESHLWETLAEEYNVKAGKDTNTLDVTVTGTGTERAIALRQPDAALAKVIENRVLTNGGTSEKRHIEFELPPNMGYSTGDYLAVVPSNPPSSVRRVTVHFGLSPEATVIIQAGGPTTFPIGKPVLLQEILSGYVELAQPATKRNLQALLEAADGSIKPSIENLIENYKTVVVDKRLSVLDILVSNPSLKISLGTFINMLPTMRVRQYSISSSPLWNPSHCTLTVSVVSAPAISGTGGQFLGVASNFLAELKPGDLVQVAVRPSASAFTLPADPSVPLVLFCAGSGLAPMRGFIQERATQIQSGRRDVGKVLLFYGCRDPEEDYMYSDAELKEWSQIGAVDVRPAFSRAKEQSEGCKYVQERILHDAVDVDVFFKQGAKFFTCGRSNVAQGIKDACITLIQNSTGTDWERATEAFLRAQKERYATDIFG